MPTKPNLQDVMSRTWKQRPGNPPAQKIPVPTPPDSPIPVPDVMPGPAKGLSQGETSYSVPLDALQQAKDFLARTQKPNSLGGLASMGRGLGLKSQSSSSLANNGLLSLGRKAMDWATSPNPGVEGLMPTTEQVIPGDDTANHRLRLQKTFGKIPAR